MNQLVEAISNVADWHGLGLRLGITMCKLRQLKMSYHGVDRLKAEMFDVWLKNSPKAAWADLITALRAMGEHTVASDIEAVYSPTTSNGMLLLSQCVYSLLCVCYESNYSEYFVCLCYTNTLFHSTSELNPVINPAVKLAHEFPLAHHWKTMAAIVALLAIVCGALLFYLT